MQTPPSCAQQVRIRHAGAGGRVVEATVDQEQGRAPLKEDAGL
jgi:hypothetical protein